MKVAVVGATGLVGKTLINVLEQRNFPVSKLIPVASERSIGKEVFFRNQPFTVIGIEAAIAARPDIALFSAGGETSRQWAPLFVEVGTCVIDNSSAWRMDPNVKLIVPEVNGDIIDGKEGIIANPNCSTIQMVAALCDIHKQLKIKRLVISTYQSITGTGQNAVDQYTAELEGREDTVNKPYPHPIFENCIPHCDTFMDNDYTKEEMKLVHETRKIMGDEDLRITATSVRVPVKGGHSESVNVEVEENFEIDQVKSIFRQSNGVILQDDVSRNEYPMPLTSYAKDEVFVGRVRLDESQPNTFNCWIVSDNLRKGAATNAVQIAERWNEIRSI